VSSLSEKYQAEVHLIFVVEDVHQYDHFYVMPAPPFLRISGKNNSKGGQQMEKICQESLSSCPLYKKHIVVGDPAKEILKFINEEKVDLVVMATHGHGEETGRK